MTMFVCWKNHTQVYNTAHKTYNSYTAFGDMVDPLRKWRRALRTDSRRQGRLPYLPTPLVQTPYKEVVKTPSDYLSLGWSKHPKRGKCGTPTKAESKCRRKWPTECLRPEATDCLVTGGSLWRRDALLGALVKDTHKPWCNWLKIDQSSTNIRKFIQWD